jgi:hypothetical protein
VTFGEFIGVISNPSLKINIYDNYDRLDGQYRGYLCSTLKGSNINNLFKVREIECLDIEGFEGIAVALKTGEK